MLGAHVGRRPDQGSSDGEVHFVEKLFGTETGEAGRDFINREIVTRHGQVNIAELIDKMKPDNHVIVRRFDT